MKIEIEINDTDAEHVKAFIEATRKAEGHHHDSHGELTPEILGAMLFQDVAMAMCRPGSWEGNNMQRVLTSHGYDCWGS